MKNLRSILRCSLFSFFFILTTGIHAQWRFLGSPEGGRVLHYDRDGGRIYVCAKSGLLFSDDEGHSWTPVSLPSYISTANKVYAENNTLYLFTQKDYLLGDFPLDLFRSNDLGLTWQNIFPFSGHIFTFHEPLVKGDTLILFADDSIAISSNKGESYVMVKNTLADPEHVIFHGSSLIAIEDEVMYSSGDLGLNWDSLYSSSSNLFGLNVLSIGDTLYRFLHRTNANLDLMHYFARSTDGGSSWVPLGNFQDPFMLYPAFFGDGTDLFVFHPNVPQTFFHSPDGGMTWNEIENEIDAQSFSFSEGVLFALGVDHIQFSTDKGETFEIHDNGFHAANISRIAYSADRMWTMVNDLVYENEGNNQWTNINSYDIIASTDDGILLALTNNILQRSDDGGMTWVVIPSSVFTQPFYNSIRDILSSGNIFFLVGTTIWYSLDKGISWEPFDEINLLDHGLSQTGHDPSNYIVCDYRNNVLKSSDGISWENITYNIFVPGNNNLKMVHSHYGHFFTLNSMSSTLRLLYGTTKWEILHNPFIATRPNAPQEEFNCMVSYGPLLLGGSYGHGVFVSYDSGDTWKDINLGLNDFQVNIIKIFNDKLYVGVDGGVWERPLSDLSQTGILEFHKELTMSVSPIPTKDFLNITINEPEVTGEINLFLFDSKGAFIQSYLNSNSHNIQFDIRNILPGIYFLHATIKDRSGVIRFVKN